MNRMPNLIFLLSTIFFTLSNLHAALEIRINSGSEEPYIIESLDDDISIQEIQSQIEKIYGISTNQQQIILNKVSDNQNNEDQPLVDDNKQTFWVELVNAQSTGNSNDFSYKLAYKSATPKLVRNYSAPVTESELKDLRYIILSLANKSYVELLLYSGSLNSAGDRIEHIHPLKFLMTIFSDEEMKIAIRNVKKKKKCWKRWMSETAAHLEEELKNNNLNMFVNDFAAKVQVNSNIISPSINKRKWEQFVNLLITHVPREGDNGRFDF